MDLKNIRDLPANISKSRLANEIYKESTFDCALPDSYVKKHHLSYEERFSIVWMYEDGSIMGAPFPITIEGVRVLSRISLAA